MAGEKKELDALIGPTIKALTEFVVKLYTCPHREEKERKPKDWPMSECCSMLNQWCSYFIQANCAYYQRMLDWHYKLVSFQESKTSAPSTPLIVKKHNPKPPAKRQGKG